MLCVSQLQAMPFAPLKVRASTSVLFKCNLHRCRHMAKPTKQHHIIVSIHVEDHFSNIRSLTKKLEFKVSGLLKISVAGPVSVLCSQLFWCDSLCCLDQELDYFMPFHQPLIFRAEITYEDLQWESAYKLLREESLNTGRHNIAVKTLVGKMIQVHASLLNTVAEVKEMIQDKEGECCCDVLQHRSFHLSIEQCRHASKDVTFATRCTCHIPTTLRYGQPP